MAETETVDERYERKRQERLAALKARQEAAPPLPSLQSLCLEKSLYKPIQLNPDRDLKFLEALKFGIVQFDAHCVYCGQSATFRTLVDRIPADVAEVKKFLRSPLASTEKLKRLVFEKGQFALHLQCMRYPDHLYSYFFVHDETQSILTKIGQTPSLADVAGADIERYRKILGDNFAELRKAIGLFAHGVGIGSFVYLRRIFEKLIEETIAAANLTGEQQAAFRQMRMAERVDALAAHLPSAVVNLKGAYAILSKGLHELTEDECALYFPVLKTAIIRMLEQRYEADEKAKIDAEIEREMASIASKLNRKNDKNS
jgi:hypothetical protein